MSFTTVMQQARIAVQRNKTCLYTNLAHNELGSMDIIVTTALFNIMIIGVIIMIIIMIIIVGTVTLLYSNSVTFTA